MSALGLLTERQVLLVLEMLGVDRPVMGMQDLGQGRVRVTLLGGDSYELDLSDKPDAPARLAQPARRRDRRPSHRRAAPGQGQP
jgi:hypothetical protein